MTLTFDKSSTIIQDLEATNYEVNSRVNIISYMLANNMNVGSDMARQYQKEYMEFYIKYQTLKDKFYREHVLPRLDGEYERWNLDFATGTVTLV